MSHLQEQEETTMPNASSVIYTGILPTGDFYVGNELPAGGFASNVEEECSVSAVEKQPVVEQQIDLSILPQNRYECFQHPIWSLSKKCVLCKKPEFYGHVISNTELFRQYGCNFIRACPEHHAMVSVHFAKQEFQIPIVQSQRINCHLEVNGIFYEMRVCGGCGERFSAICDSESSFCNKGCQGNWLDRRF
jgi:hypothetical protein